MTAPAQHGRDRMSLVVGGLKAGTQKEWSERRKYKGVLRYGSEVDWTCGHSHATSHDALECAFTELNRTRQMAAGGSL